MRCLVVDDDPLACQLVEDYLQRIGGIDYCLKLSDGATALHVLAAEPFDAVFVDLELPGIDGASLIEALPRDVPVVVVSASAEFGAKSYDFGVVDYLVKPLEFARFAKAVARLRAAAGASPDPSTAGAAGGVIFLRDGSRIHRVNLNDVTRVEAQANYASFHLEGGRSVMALVSMRRLENILPANFLRVHRSHIVNRDHIHQIEGGEVLVGDTRVPVGQSYRAELPGKLGVIN